MKTKIIILIFLSLSVKSIAQISVLLNIPGRLQWDNANGYCGETSIQMSALYYGNYICEDVCRTVAGGELLVAGNDVTALNAFSFTYEEWDYNQATPQYQNYLVWTKQHLNNRHPVIITVFVLGMSDPDYDHIIPAIGFNATNVNTFNGADELMFNDCYDSIYYTRTFASVWDTRSMSGNGATNEYCIPKNVDYGIAVTGIKDVQHVTKPVHLSIDSWDEPNISLGENPKVLHATITADSLTAGQKYALLRYNNYLNVPSSNFNPLTADSAIYFTASSATESFTNSFMSNTAVFYRCIPYNYNDILEIKTNKDLIIYPSPAINQIVIENTDFSIGDIIGIYDVQGKLLMQNNLLQTKTNINISSLSKGVYVVKLSNNRYSLVKRFLKK